MHKNYTGLRVVWLALKQNEPNHVPFVLQPVTVIHLTRAITLVRVNQTGRHLNLGYTTYNLSKCGIKK